MACDPLTRRIALRGEDRAARNGTGSSFTDPVRTRTGFHFWLDSQGNCPTAGMPRAKPGLALPLMHIAAAEPAHLLSA